MRLYITMACVWLALQISAQSKAVYYNTIDNKVFLFSKNKTTGFDSVVSYVNSNFAAKEDRVRAYYTWIALNISYDTKRLQDLEILKHMQLGDASDISQNADTVFRKRKAVCEGFSKLMVKFCGASGIPASMVTGYTKTPEGEIVTDILHAWNAVKTDSTWHLLDVTWSNGYMNQNHEYKKRFSDKYFLSRPAEFVQDHLPLDPMWQMQTEPLSKNGFFKQTGDHGTGYHYNDTISAYMAAPASQKEYIDYLHYHSFDPENPMHKTNIDVYVNNQAADYLDLSSVYYQNFVAFANANLTKSASTANIKKAKAMLEEARLNSQKAIDVLRGKKAYTPFYETRFKEMMESADESLKAIHKDIDLLASLQKSVQKQQPKK